MAERDPHRDETGGSGLALRALEQDGLAEPTRAEQGDQWTGELAERGHPAEQVAQAGLLPVAALKRARHLPGARRVGVRLHPLVLVPAVTQC